MKLTIIEDIKKLTIEEALKDNYFIIHALGTGLNGKQLFRFTLEDIEIAAKDPNILFVRVD
jgi:hypothetical protein